MITLSDHNGTCRGLDAPANEIISIRDHSIGGASEINIQDLNVTMAIEEVEIFLAVR